MVDGRKKNVHKKRSRHRKLKGVPTVLVIHTNGNSAAWDMMDLLEKHGLKQQAIHWHCFSGDKDLTTQLCEQFNKLKLSISSLVLSKPDIQEAVTAIPLEHLILETDSPYLDPIDIGKVQRREQGLRNMPWSLMLHAKHIAAIWNMPMEMIVELSNQNISSLYGVQSPTTRVPPVVDMSPFYFQGKSHVMSNMYPCKIQTGNKTFHGTEQAYHYRCACDLGDWKAQNVIENSRDGFEAKRAGKLIPKE